MYLNSEVYLIYFSNLRLRIDGVRGACMVFQDFEFRAESEYGDRKCRPFANNMVSKTIVKLVALGHVRD